MTDTIFGFEREAWPPWRKGQNAGVGYGADHVNTRGPIAAANFDWYQWTGGQIGAELLQ